MPLGIRDLKRLAARDLVGNEQSARQAASLAAARANPLHDQGQAHHPVNPVVLPWFPAVSPGPVRQRYQPNV